MFPIRGKLFKNNISKQSDNQLIIIKLLMYIKVPNSYIYYVINWITIDYRI